MDTHITKQTEAEYHVLCKSLRLKLTNGKLWNLQTTYQGQSNAKLWLYIWASKYTMCITKYSKCRSRTTQLLVTLLTYLRPIKYMLMQMVPALGSVHRSMTNWILTSSIVFNSFMIKQQNLQFPQISFPASSCLSSAFLIFPYANHPSASLAKFL